MKLTHFIIIALTLPAVLHSCSKPAAQDNQGKSVPLTWKAQVDTKSAAPLNTEALKTTPFGVNAYWTDKGTAYANPSTSYFFLDNRKVVYNSSENFWECDPKAWWVLEKQISFFAYAPWTDDVDVFKFASPIDNRGLLRGEFAQNDNTASQIDLLIAAPVLDRTDNGSPVPLTFKHSLSKILIYLNITGETESHKFKLDHMSLTGIAGSGKFNYDTSAGGFTWDEIPRSDASVRNKTYDLSIGAGTLKDAYLTHEEDPALAGKTGLDRYLGVQTSPDGELLLLPQPLTSKAKLTLDLDSYKDSGGGVWVKDKDEDPFHLILPAENSWEAGNIYCYTITLDVTHRYIIQFGITIVPWGSYSQTISYPE